MLAKLRSECAVGFSGGECEGLLFLGRMGEIKKTMFDEHGRGEADDGARTHDINLGKVALYH